MRDKFLLRLMIPIQNFTGQSVGFTARTLPFDKRERPKYLNSNESDIFQKGKLWYGWHLARPSIREKGFAIVVEGNMDVITAYKYGIKNTIAAMGTSFTVDQLKSLKMLTKEIYIAFDNDNAGLISGKKLFVEAVKAGFEVGKIIIPDIYKDIDEYLNSFNINDYSQDTISKIESQIEKISFIDYFINRLQKDLTGSNNKLQKEAINELCQLIAILDPISREQKIQRIYNLTKISKTALETYLNNYIDSQSNINNRHNITIDHTDNGVGSNNINKNPLFNTSILQKFKELCLAYSLDKLKDEQREKLIEAFPILQSILQDHSLLSDYTNLDNFILATIDELELIYKQKGQSIFTDKYLQISWREIRSTINNNYIQMQTQLELTPQLLQSFNKINAPSF
jgi:DNA primase